jgi:hypothetical protein
MKWYSVKLLNTYHENVNSIISSETIIPEKAWSMFEGSKISFHDSFFVRNKQTMYFSLYYIDCIIVDFYSCQLR